MKRTKVLIFLLVAVVFALGVTIASMLWPRPTEIAAVIRTTKVTFVLAPERSDQINDLDFESIRLDGFQDVKYAPLPPKLDWSRDSSLTVELASKTGKPGVFRSFEVKPGLKVVMTAEGANTLCFVVSKDSEDLNFDLNPPVPARLSSSSFDADLIVSQPGGPFPAAQIKSKSGPLRACVDLDKNEMADPMWDNIHISWITFEHENIGSKVTESNLKSAEVSYENLPEKAPINLGGREVLQLGNLDQHFTISTITIQDSKSTITTQDNNRAELSLRLHGIAGKLDAGSANFTRDRRVTLFEELRHNPTIGVPVAILVWCLPAIATFLTIYNTIRGIER